MPKEFLKSLLLAIGFHGVLLGILLFTWPFLAQSVFSINQYQTYKISLVSLPLSFQSTQGKTKIKSLIHQNETKEKINIHLGLTPSVPKEMPSQEGRAKVPEKEKENQKESSLGISFLPQDERPENSSGENGGGGSDHQTGKNKEVQASLYQTKGVATPSHLAVPRYGQNRVPSYPAIAREQGWQGTTLLKVQVLKNGLVGSLEVLRSSGFSILDQSALKGVKEWKFIPGQKNGQPTEMFVQIPVTFKLE